MNPKIPYSNEVEITRMASAGHAERAEAAILEAGGMMYGILHGYERLGRLLDQFPTDVIQSNILILSLNCIYLCKKGQPRRARALLDDVKETERNHYIWQYTDLWVAAYLDERASPDRLRQWMTLESKLPIGGDLNHGLFFNNMLIISARLARFKQAGLWAQRALEVFRRLRMPNLQFYVHIHLCDMNIVLGNITTAHRHLASAQRYFDNGGVVWGSERQLLSLCQLSIAYELGRFDDIAVKTAEIRRTFVEGEDGWMEIFLQSCRIGVFATYFTEGYSSALSYLENCQIDYHQRHGRYSDVLEIFHAKLQYLEGRSGDSLHTFKRVDIARVHSAIGRYATDTLRARLGLGGEISPNRKQDPRAVIHFYLIEAGKYRAEKRNAMAKRSVESALRVAASNGGLAAIFLEYRIEVEPYSSALSTGSFARGYVQLARLARHVHKTILASYAKPDNPDLEGVSRQQIRVLSQLYTGATNKEIARSLGISEDTVKYHLKALFKRFQVVKRGQLIENIRA